MDIFRTEVFCLYILGLFCSSFQFLLSSPAKDLARCQSTVSHGKYLYPFRERCYEFVIFQEKYWADARHDCQSKGGDLVVVDAAAIQEFIVAALITLGNPKQGLWIGLTDSRHELHWEWVNGEPLQGYNNWAHREGGANALHFTQDCAQIRMNDNGLWHDRECHLWPQKFSYICQYEMLPKPSTTMKTTTRTSPTTTSTTTMTKSTTQPKLSTTAETTKLAPTSTSTTEALTSTTVKTTTTTTVKASSTSIKSQSPWQHTSESKLLLALTSASLDTNISSTRNSDTVSTQFSPSKPTSTFNTTTEMNKLSMRNDGVTYKDTTSGTNSVASVSAPRELVHNTAGRTTEEPVICSEVDCSKSCPNGYSGVYVDLNGCINCRCN